MNDPEPVDDVLHDGDWVLGDHASHVLSSEQTRIVLYGLLLVIVVMLVVITPMQLRTDVALNDVLRRVVAPMFVQPQLLRCPGVDWSAEFARNTFSWSDHFLFGSLNTFLHDNNARIIFISWDVAHALKPPTNASLDIG